MKKRIALLYGGAPSEHEVSLMGYEYVSALLEDSEYEILPVRVAKDGGWTIRIGTVTVPAHLTSREGGGLYTGYGLVRIDAAIPLLHGEGGEDGSVQGALTCAGVPFVGADVCTSALCIDKAYSKAVAESLGIPTVRSVCPRQNESAERALKQACEVLDFPMFIKPRRLGSSVGAYPVQDPDDFLEKYPLACAVGHGLVIIEKCLKDKRELECAFVEQNGQRKVTPPGEILLSGFYSYGEKYSGKSRTSPRASLDKDTERLIVHYAGRLADAVMLRHLGRIDFFFSDGEIIFNEINTFPGFTGESLYPKMLEAYGISPREALLSFIEDALVC